MKHDPWQGQLLIPFGFIKLAWFIREAVEKMVDPSFQFHSRDNQWAHYWLMTCHRDFLQKASQEAERVAKSAMRAVEDVDRIAHEEDGARSDYLEWLSSEIEIFVNSLMFLSFDDTPAFKTFLTAKVASIEWWVVAEAYYLDIDPVDPYD